MAEWTPELAFADPDVAIGHAGPIVAHFWNRQVTAQALQQLQLAIAARTSHAPLAVLTVIEPGATVPDQAAREMSAAYLDAVAELIGVSALLVEGPAMQSAAFRGVDAGFTMLAKRDYPHEAFDSLADASAWIAEHAPARWDLTAERFESIVEELRRLVPR